MKILIIATFTSTVILGFGQPQLIPWSIGSVVHPLLRPFGIGNTWTKPFQVGQGFQGAALDPENMKGMDDTDIENGTPIILMGVKCQTDANCGGFSCVKGECICDRTKRLCGGEPESYSPEVYASVAKNKVRPQDLITEYSEINGKVYSCAAPYEFSKKRNGCVSCLPFAPLSRGQYNVWSDVIDQCVHCESVDEIWHDGHKACIPIRDRCNPYSSWDWSYRRCRYNDL